MRNWTYIRSAAQANDRSLYRSLDRITIAILNLGIKALRARAKIEQIAIMQITICWISIADHKYGYTLIALSKDMRES